MSEINIYLALLAFLTFVGLLVVVGIPLLLLGATILDRIDEARLNGHVNATVFGLGLHLFSMKHARNRRFVSNAKLAGYLIREGRRVSVGFGLPAPVQRVIKKWRRA